ncbi:MAG: hypothetical protein IPO01_17810 [Chitinophagaceae bacterium]|nr:hypothetical protein [Chitinophagaceae bacterium]
MLNIFGMPFLLPLTGRGLLQGWNSWLCPPEPLLIKDIKAEVNKQKLKIECPAQMKHNSDKMTIAPMSSQPCSKPNVTCSLVNERACYFWLSAIAKILSLLA